MGVSGRAELACQVTSKGTVNCTVASEDPPDQGFGAAAMKLAHLFRMRPQTKDGAPTDGGKVNIPLRFVLAKDD